MNATETPELLTLSRFIKAPPARVFTAWTTPEMAQWICPGQRKVLLAEVDGRVGGKYHVKVNSEHCGEAELQGTFREIKPPSRIAFTWSLGDCFPEYQGRQTLVTIDLAEEKGGTRLTLTHEGLPTEEIRARHNEGWDGSLDNLENLF